MVISPPSSLLADVSRVSVLWWVDSSLFHCSEPGDLWCCHAWSTLSHLSSHSSSSTPQCLSLFSRTGSWVLWLLTSSWWYPSWSPSPGSRGEEVLLWESSTAALVWVQQYFRPLNHIWSTLETLNLSDQTYQQQTEHSLKMKKFLRIFPIVSCISLVFMLLSSRLESFSAKKNILKTT